MSAIDPRSREDIPTREIGETPLTIDEFVSMARRETRPALSEQTLQRIKRSAETLRRHHEGGQAIYGVTTSVGGSSGTTVENADAATLAAADCTLIVTDHSDFDVDMIIEHSDLVVDTRNLTQGRTDEKIRRL